MWITGEVELPGEVLDAQRESRLVLFAGAGISIDAPSRMPSFAGLISDLALESGESGLPEWAAERPDAFLGSLEHDGFPVHDRVAARLTPGGKQAPNDFHRALVRLFRQPQEVRLVTTNHDPFLTAAVENEFGPEVESFYAPALPIGGGFTGVVYLHGGVSRQPERLVLTDRDFGRAYLAEGWATTFLRAMYADYDVLFIGYSHSEPVLRYLARGLSGRTARYAFDSADGDLSAWRALGITPIPYPGGDSTERHAALRVAAMAWAERTQMGYMDHEALIREACGGAPPLDASMADYVRQTLRDPATARFFSAYAVDIEWLTWIKDEPEFRALFGVGELSPSSFELAEWFATKFVLQHPEVALSLLQELGGKMAPPLWLSCARQLWVANPRPAPAVFAKWVSALIESPPALQGSRYLEYLLRACRWPEDRGIALLLFAHLTDPHPEFEPRLAFLGETTPGVRVSIGIRGDDTALRDAWVDYFLPNIDEFAEQLEPIVAGQLVRAHELLKAVAEADDRWDPTSYMRPRIED